MSSGNKFGISATVCFDQAAMEIFFFFFFLDWNQRLSHASKLVSQPLITSGS